MYRRIIPFLFELDIQDCFLIFTDSTINTDVDQGNQENFDSGKVISDAEYKNLPEEDNESGEDKKDDLPKGGGSSESDLKLEEGEMYERQRMDFGSQFMERFSTYHI